MASAEIAAALLGTSARCRASVLPGVSNSVHLADSNRTGKPEDIAVEGDGSGHVADEDDGVAEFGHWLLREEPTPALRAGVGLLYET